MIIFLLTERIGHDLTEHIIFPKDRNLIAFGRSPLAEYRLLHTRTDETNRKISRIQATLETRFGEWFISPGCTERSARGDIKPSRPASPLWMDDREVNMYTELSVGMDIYLYREIDDYSLLSCLNEATLEQRSSRSIDDTEPYDLLKDLQHSLKVLETLVVTGFVDVRLSIESLNYSDRLQSKQIDTQRKTYLKLGLAVALCGLGILGGSQLLDLSQRKDLFYDLTKLALSTGAGTSGIALLKNAIDNKRTPSG